MDIPSFFDYTTAYFEAPIVCAESERGMPMVEFVLIGLTAGFMAGFFGVGGGAITVPLLLYAGVSIKFAVGISAMQMVFSSVYGSMRNVKNRLVDSRDAYPFGLGGIAGAFLGGNLLDVADERVIEFSFLSLIIFALVRVFYSSHEPRGEKKRKSLYFNLIIGLVIGMIAGMLGVGGSILLIPILVGYLNFTTKEAVSVGLFFVMFSSIAAFSTLAGLGYVDYAKGLLVAVSSLIGVRAGQYAVGRTGTKSHKNWTVTMYVVLFVLTSYKIFFDEDF